MTRRISGWLISPGRLLIAGTALLGAIGTLLPGALTEARMGAQLPEPSFVKPSGPKFEVASVKLVPDYQAVLSSGGHIGIKIDRARVDIGYWSIKQLVLRAYGLQPYQVSGPDWMDAVRFNVIAKLPEGATEAQLPGMLQWLLAERFGFAAHHETKDLPGFALVVGKGGPKMRPAVPDADAPTDSASNTMDVLWGEEAAEAFGLKIMNVTSDKLHLECTKLPMSALVAILSSYLRAPLTDLTGLKGKYQATLEFSLASTAAAVNQADGPGGDGPIAAEPPDGSLFSTVKGLGLALERRKAPVAVLVVDRLERVPTEN